MPPPKEWLRDKKVLLEEQDSLPKEWRELCYLHGDTQEIIFAYIAGTPYEKAKQIVLEALRRDGEPV